MAKIIMWKRAARQMAAASPVVDTNAVYATTNAALAADALPLLGRYAHNYDLAAATRDLFTFDPARGGYVPRYRDLLGLGDILGRHRRPGATDER